MLLLLSALAHAESLEFTDAPNWKPVYQGARITRLTSMALLPVGVLLTANVDGDWPLAVMGAAGGGIVLGTLAETGALYGKADHRPSIAPMVYGLAAISVGASAVNNEHFANIDPDDPVGTGGFILGTGILAFGVVQPVVNRYAFRRWDLTVTGRLDAEQTGLAVSGRF